MSEHSSHWLDSVVHSAEEGLTSWRPAADVYRTAKGWLVKFDLAGVREQDLSLAVSGRTLSVSGTRRDHTTEEGCRHYRLEIMYSHFQRTIELPIDLESARINSQLSDGMLCVSIEQGQ